MAKWIVMLVLAACSARPVAAPAIGNAAPSLGVPAPTKTDTVSATDMRYFYWAPGIPLPRGRGETIEQLAARVLASSEVTKLLGVRPGVDTFVHKETDLTKHMVVFQQAYTWRGRAVLVGDGPNLTVELAGGNTLVYLGTGFRPDVDVPVIGDDFLTEPAAGVFAVVAFEHEVKLPGTIKPHIHPEPGLAVLRGENAIGYWISVEGGGESRMIFVDAQTGAVLRTYDPVIR